MLTQSRALSLWRRWPTAVAIGTAALFVLGDGSDGRADRVDGFAEAMLVLQLEYLILARLRRRGASWPVSAAVVVMLLVLQALDVVSPAAVLVIASLRRHGLGRSGRGTARSGHVRGPGPGRGRFRRARADGTLRRPGPGSVPGGRRLVLPRSLGLRPPPPGHGRLPQLR